MITRAITSTGSKWRRFKMSEIFCVGDLVQMAKPVEFSLPDYDIGVVLKVVEAKPDQAVRVGFCSDSQAHWVAAYRLKKIG